ncbi:MAG: AbrB family transcriptional regulator [Solirubrobacterales bacterium]|nr:AbrB family transcriptional regulator [Solirubrobacterales bacterium]
MRWLLLIALTVSGALAGEAVGLPSAALFAGMLAGIAVALAWPREDTGLPPRLRRLSEAAIGVVLGTFVTPSTLEEIGTDLVPILAVTLATLGLSVLGGLALARWTGLDRPTAAFGTIAGGATGIIVMARDLGADARMVAVLQYLRVVVVVLLTPIVAAVAFAGTSADPGASADGGLQGLVFTAICVVGGLALVPRVRVPAPTLLLPLGVAALLTVLDAPGVAPVPELLQQLAFGAIGLEVGLRFTPESLRQAGRLLLPALTLIAALLVASFGLALVLAPLTGVSTLTAYLATTPGGLYAVLAVAVGSDADATFVLAVQVLRLLVMLLAAPLLARRLSARPERSPPT